jgi:carbonic anhydrase
LPFLFFQSLKVKAQSDSVTMILQHVVALVFFQAAQTSLAQTWVYALKGGTKADAVTQAATWGEGGTNPLCTGGKEQSPIDVVTKTVVKTTLPTIETAIETSLSFVRNTGHGFQLFETSHKESRFNPDDKVNKIKVIDETASAKGFSMIHGSKFNFYSVLWHTPSENTIDGQHFVMEAHFRHQLADAGDAADTYPTNFGNHRLAIIGLLYDLGTDSQCNSMLDTFWSYFPQLKGLNEFKGVNPNLNVMLADKLLLGYYHWYGSLTEPPCTEGVSWNLLKAREVVCQAQVDKLKFALGSTQDGVSFNNRVTQPLSHRAVALMEPGNPRPAATQTSTLAVALAADKWSYAPALALGADAATQQAWGGLCSAGHEQSPIDVITMETLKGGLPTIATAFAPTVSYVKTMAHGFQLFESTKEQHKLVGNVPTQEDPVAGVVPTKGYSTIGGSKFSFHRVTWHTPSENTIDGKAFAMEAQFVHQLDDALLAGTFHRLAVIALLYDLGTDLECNAFLTHFWDKFPASTGNAVWGGDSKVLDFNAKLKQEIANGYYHWMGSLTAPPCTEGVSWNLLKTQEKVCQGQVNTLSTALGATQSGLGFNNRVTQPLNHRLVTEMSMDIGDSRVKTMSNAQWTSCIAMAQDQRLLSQKMTSEFLYVAKDMHPAGSTSKTLMLATSSLFEGNLRKLIGGSQDATIPPAPNQRILELLHNVQFQWITMKRLIVGNVDTIRSSTKMAAILEELYVQNMLVLTSSSTVAVAYTKVAQGLGAPTAGLIVEVADRQRMLTQKLAKEALFIGLKIRESDALVDLANTMSLFEDSHRDIVRGVGSMPEMPQLAEVCTLAEMKEVNGRWNAIQPIVTSIVDTYVASDDGLKQIMQLTPTLLAGLDSAVKMYRNTNNVCDLAKSIKAEGWIKNLAEVGMQREKTQTALRLFAQALKGVDVEQTRTALTTALSEGSEHMRRCLEGSYYLEIPTPPTQAFVNALIHAEQYWSKFQAHISKDMMQSVLVASDLGKSFQYGHSCTTAMDTVAAMYVDISLSLMPNLPVVAVEISWRQALLLERMLQATLLISMDHAIIADADAFAHYVKTFEVSHSELLLGRVVQQGNVVESTDGVALLFPQRGLPITNDACTLTLMMTVLKRFNVLKTHLQPLVSGTKEASEHVAAITTALPAMSSTANSMFQTVAKYSSLNLIPDVCNTQLMKIEWESGIQNAGKVASLFLSSQKDFFLIASGLADTWLRQADIALEEHKGYIGDDVESPILVEALTAFKDGWFKIGKNDVEREFTLKNAYITQNPHPLGNKHMLDYASGPEEYHAAHKKYHVVYRDILLTRNYYDVFIFDTQGNLIYSVYKELDFATNFDGDGDGQWKDSGLGEAFRAAMAHPNEVNIIDWKPYGPSFGALASFLAKGIMSQTGMVIGVYSTQMPPESKPINSHEILLMTARAFDDSIHNLKFGVPSDNLPPPANQVIAASVFDIYNEWQIIRELFKEKSPLVVDASVNKVLTLRTQAPLFLAKIEVLMANYVDAAWMGDTSVAGTKLRIASQQLATLQELAGDAALFYMGPDYMKSTGAELIAEDVLAKIQRFEAEHLVLMQGRLDRRRLQDDEERVPLKTDVPPSIDAMTVKLMDDVTMAFSSLKETLTHIVVEGEDGSTGASVDSLRSVVENTNAAEGAMDQSTLFYASKILAVVLEPIALMAPMPLTGAWNAGVTMRAVALIAEGYINEEQLLLPGYSLNHNFFDDKCSATVSNQIVLREMGSVVKYAGIGGSGCTNVCAGTAFVAASIRLPYLSYECAGVELSDSTEYPDITRFGTLTTPQSTVIKAIKDTYSQWTHVEVVSGDPADYRTAGESLVEALLELEVEGQYAYAFESKWDDIVRVMDTLRKKKRRAIFVMGSEAFFRKLICASIVVGSNMGISWMSEGAWRDDWWTKSDAILDSHQAWILEDSQSWEVKTAMELFKQGWIAIAPTDKERSDILFPLYVTDEKENLEFVSAPGAYHLTHKAWHGTFRKQMIDRNYYDVFMFDRLGNMIYSVYKETDYATNFGINKNLDADFMKWQDSGLGDAFRLANVENDIVHMTPWTPYGPSAGALASFLAITVRNDDGDIIGVFSTQMPPDTMSIDNVEPDCSLEAITVNFEGAINFVGLGKPVEADMEKQVPCFKGRTAKAFLLLLDNHLDNGYPLDDSSTAIHERYDDIKAHAADGTCVFAYALRQLLQDGISLHDIREHTIEAYEAFVNFIKIDVEFQGISGLVNFTGNDKPNYLAVQQVQQGKKVLVGTTNGTIDFTVNGGPRNVSWMPPHPDVPPPEPDFPYWAFQVLLPILCICCPGLAACVKNF